MQSYKTFQLSILAFLFAILPQPFLHAAEDESLVEIERTIVAQAEAWNCGDLDEFMKPYWNDEQLTFSSGGQTQRGWMATRQRYTIRYPDRATMGKLTFSQLETQSLGGDAALTLGRWQIAREQPVGGNFSLVWRKIDGRWFIVHDHSSAEPEPK